MTKTNYLRLGTTKDGMVKLWHGDFIFVMDPNTARELAGQLQEIAVPRAFNCQPMHRWIAKGRLLVKEKKKSE